MYKKRTLLPISLVLALGLSGCASNVEETEVQITAPERMYQTAQKSLDLGNILKATRVLEALESRYPFGPQATQVQLDLIYAYYRAGNNDQALASIDRFLRLNPTHPDIDYVYYMRGLSNMQSDQNMFHEMLEIDRSDRDPQFATQAFNDFKQLLISKPNSLYAADAKQRMTALKNRLAKHHLAIANYYFERKIYVAAINRSKQILESFTDTGSTKNALEIMKASYIALKQDDLATKTDLILKQNFAK
ncbi:outer membrane protein assembly factor BamD [Alteromonadales bacterium alter-6D02]|nr:outer membrane protein assembly factor BamD [Alteromonadales bacterium alter-6D02]